MPRRINIDDILTISNRSTDFLGSMVDQHQSRIVGAIDKLERRIIDDMTMLAANPDGRLEGIKVNMKQAQQVHKKLVQDFAAEYNIPVDTITGSFGSISDFVEDSYRYLGEASQFSQVAKHTLDTLRDSQYEQFLRYGVEAQETISGAMYNAVIAGEPFSSLLSTVEGILTGHVDRQGRSMVAYAKQHAFDSVMNFNNQANLLKSSEIGIEHFLYVGNVIETTRPFCARRVEKIYTRAQIEAWDDMPWKGKAGPAMTHRGGYNCRHHWRGVKPEWFDLEKGEDIPAEIVKAKRTRTRKPKAQPTPLGTTGLPKPKPTKTPELTIPPKASAAKVQKLRSEWVVVDNYDDAALQMRSKYNIMDFEFQGGVVPWHERVEIMNELGESMAGAVRANPGLSKIISKNRPLQKAVYWTNTDDLHEDYFQTVAANIKARNARPGAKQQFVPTRKNHVNRVYGYYDFNRAQMNFVKREGEFGKIGLPGFRGADHGKTGIDRWYTFRHEYGHHIQREFMLNDADIMAKLNLTTPEAKQLFSAYSAKNNGEFAAELFAFASHPANDVDLFLMAMRVNDHDADVWRAAFKKLGTDIKASPVPYRSLTYSGSPKVPGIAPKSAPVATSVKPAKPKNWYDYESPKIDYPSPTGRILYPTETIYADAVKPRPVKIRREDMFSPKTDYVRVGIDENKKGIWELGGKAVSAKTAERLNALGISNSWTDVILSKDPNAKLLAFGKLDGKPKFAYSEKWIKEQQQIKFDRIKEFHKDLPKLRKAIEEGVKIDDPMAWMMYIEDRTAIRVGKEVADTFGITTLQAQHIRILGMHDVMIEFVGKGSKNAVYFFNDPALANFFKRKLNELPSNGQLFPGITHAKARNWIRKATGNKTFKFHDFRTHHGTELAYENLQKYAGMKLSPEAKKAAIDETCKIVSDFLHNLPDTARDNYIDPAVWDLIGGLD